MVESWVIAVLTAALVGATFLYERDTNRMVGEMRKARGAQVMPRIVVTIQDEGAGAGFWRVMNVGPGPALDLEVQVTPEPYGTTRAFSMPVMTQGEHHDLIPLEDPSYEGSRDFLRLDEATTRYNELRMTGRCRDVLGDEHAIDETLEIREWWEAVKAAQIRLPQDPAREAIRVLEKIEKNLRAIAGRLPAR